MVDLQDIRRRVRNWLISDQEAGLALDNQLLDLSSMDPGTRAYYKVLITERKKLIRYLSGGKI